MIPLNKFLEKFSRITPPEFFIKEAIITGLHEILNISLEQDKVRFNKKQLYVTVVAPSVIKHEIMLQQDRLITHINKKLPRSSFIKKIV